MSAFVALTSCIVPKLQRIWRLYEKMFVSLRMARTFGRKKKSLNAGVWWFELGFKKHTCEVSKWLSSVNICAWLASYSHRSSVWDAAWSMRHWPLAYILLAFLWINTILLIINLLNYSVAYLQAANCTWRVDSEELTDRVRTEFLTPDISNTLLLPTTFP